MGLTATDYLHQLQALLPLGPAWPRDDDAPITRMLSGLAAEMARVDGRAWQMMEEADPRTAAELFADWERVAGLPDVCALAYGGDQTQTQRRAALVGRIISQGGQSPAYYVAIAAALGYVIAITEFREHSVNDDAEDDMRDATWSFFWQVNAALSSVTEIAVESDVNEPLAAWGNALLECVINRLKPAHTAVLYGYN